MIRPSRTYTAIAGMVRNGVVTIAGDSAGVDSNWALSVRADKKVFELGSYVIGFCGSFRGGQLLRYKLQEKDHDPRCDTEKYMATEFVDAVRKCFKDGGLGKKDKEEHEENCAPFLVGYDGRLFCVEGDFQVAESVDPYAATGCAADIALGAFHGLMRSTHWDELTPTSILNLVMDSCARYSAAVRPPFTVVQGGRKREAKDTKKDSTPTDIEGES